MAELTVSQQQTADRLTRAAKQVARQLVREGVDPDEACRAAGIAAAEAYGEGRAER